jgi:hypothetical protein
MFFLLIFGLATHLKQLGAGSERTCPRCHNTTTWPRLRESTQLTLFFIPVLRWGRRGFEACPVCGQRAELLGAAPERGIHPATAERHRRRAVALK